MYLDTDVPTFHNRRTSRHAITLSIPTFLSNIPIPSLRTWSLDMLLIRQHGTKSTATNSSMPPTPVVSVASSGSLGRSGRRMDSVLTEGTSLANIVCFVIGSWRRQERAGIGQKPGRCEVSTKMVKRSGLRICTPVLIGLLAHLNIYTPKGCSERVAPVDVLLGKR